MADPVWVDGVTPLNAVNMTKLQTRDEKGVANGYAPVGSDGKIPAGLLPAVSGGADLTYEGDYAAATAYQDGDIVVKDGIVYLCVGGPVTGVAPDPAPWGAARPQKNAELAYVERTTSATGTATTEAGAETLLTLPAVTLDGQTAIDIDVSLQLVQHTVAQAFVWPLLYDGSTLIGRFGAVYVPTANAGEPLRGVLRLTPSAGVHNYTIRAFGSTAGTWTVVAGVSGAGSYGPSSARITAPQSQIPIIAGANLPVSYGTTLPVNPVDGQEAILVDSLTNPTYQWRFRYNAGSTSAYKWEFVGGAPANVVDAALASGFTAVYPTVTPSTPSFVAPRAGEYYGSFGCTVSNGTVGGGAAAAIVVNAAKVDGTLAYASPGGASWAGSVGRDPTLLPAVGAGQVIQLGYGVLASGSASADRRSLSVYPKRVS